MTALAWGVDVVGKRDLPDDSGYMVLPRRVTIAGLAALMMSGLSFAGTTAWQAMEMKARVNSLEEADKRTEVRLQAMDVNRDRVTRVEARLDMALEILQRLDRRGQ